VGCIARLGADAGRLRGRQRPHRTRRGRRSADGSRDIAVDWSDENGDFTLQDGGDFEQEADGHFLLRSEAGDLYGGIVYNNAIVVTFDFCHDGQPETAFAFER
jgi:hypothetical protein